MLIAKGGALFHAAEGCVYRGDCYGQCGNGSNAVSGCQRAEWPDHDCEGGLRSDGVCGDTQWIFNLSKHGVKYGAHVRQDDRVCAVDVFGAPSSVRTIHVASSSSSDPLDEVFVSSVM